MKLLILVALVIVFVGGVFAFNNNGDFTSKKTNLRDDDPATIFKNRCAKCHMADGTGKDYYTPDFTDAKWQATVKDEELINAITNGQNDMPAFGGTLTDDQIKVMVKYVRSLAKSKQ